MYLLGKITVTSVLPEELKRLKDIAYNLWWSWNTETIDLFRDIDLILWERSGKNPVRFLQEVSLVKLEEKLADPVYMSRYRKVTADFDNYLSSTDTWFKKSYPELDNHRIAYFSAEFGLTEVLPIYSGGLGVLSGDHCKSASDLGLPFTAIGLLYKQGYFRQHINQEGWQETQYYDLNLSQLPVVPATGPDGQHVFITLELPGRLIHAKIWHVKIGRNSLYPLDTDVDQNSRDDRALTSRLYGGDQETRIQQEILLGIGGIRALRALGINASIYHMNEGHSAFMGLELLRLLIKEKSLNFKEALEVVSSSAIFTTHTPVPAGNDVFPFEMIDRYFGSFWDQLGISRHEFLDLGLKVGDQHNFNMTVLALTLAGRKNGVSELHGAVSRSIFNNVWPGIPEEEVPISHVTNGIHTLTWLSPKFKDLYVKYLGEDWKEHFSEKSLWDRVENIPDELLWKVHCELKKEMVDFIRQWLKEQRRHNNESAETIREADTLLNPDALTIGFARRFATYKRANLIFRDAARIQRILNNPDMPLQLVFAGKAHPADRPAHEIIKNINDIARQEGFRGKVILLENYNMTVARKLVQGVDIWLNNPRRPLEASGTSGQKVCINGVINFSVLDGWWCEGYNGRNGWAIGDDTFFENEWYQDNADSESIYSTLENEIIPLFYKRNPQDIPVGWIKVMKESIRSLTYMYSTHRMVQEYNDRFYVPSMKRVDWISTKDFAPARNLAAWKSALSRNWPQVQIYTDQTVLNPSGPNIQSDQPVSVYTTVRLGENNPSDVKVELYYGRVSGNNLEAASSSVMQPEEKLENGLYRFSASVSFQDGGEYGYTIRVIPNNPDLVNIFDMGLIRWAVQ